MDRDHNLHRDYFASLMEAKDPETDRGFSQEELISEAGLLIIAGSDTMATGITSTIFYLLHYDEEKLLRLQREVRAAFTNVEDIRGKSLASLEFLLACLDEGMRLSPGVGGLLPREVLSGGMIIDGQSFPQGVDVGVPHYAIHHNETYFPDAFEFKPERWLTEAGGGNPESIALARSAFCPFGVGRTSCVGKTIAYREMSIILARIIWLYDMRLAPGVAATLGEGHSNMGYGRTRKLEFQTYDNFTSTHFGPLVQFQEANRYEGQ